MLILLILLIAFVIIVAINIKRKKDIENSLRFKVMYGMTGEEKE